MRDIVRDMAIITVAKQYRDAAWDVDDFLDYYNENDIERQRMLSFLDDMQIVEEKHWTRDVFDPKYLEERHVYFWAWK